jgi:hypothetical protein
VFTAEVIWKIETIYSSNAASRIWREAMGCCLIDNPEIEWSRLVDWGLVSLKGRSLKAVL